MSLISAIDSSGMTPELAADLAKAQAAVDTVGKDKRNNQGSYNYATADAMIRASRKPLSENGLSIVTTWGAEPVEVQPGDIGNQFVGATVTMHWLLLHKSGGKLSGTAEMDAICSRARPTDKAVAATLTYMHGFILRGLLNLDRDEEDQDAVDRREETDFRGRQSSKARAKQAANAATGGKLVTADTLPAKKPLDYKKVVKNTLHSVCKCEKPEQADACINEVTGGMFTTVAELDKPEDAKEIHRLLMDYGAKPDNKLEGLAFALEVGDAIPLTEKAAS